MSVIGVIFILVVCVAMPVLAIRSARELKRQRVKPSVPEILVSTLLTHGVVLALAIFTARSHSIELFPAPSFAATDAIAGAAFLLLALVSNIVRWNSMDALDRAELSWLRPQGPRDLIAWAGIALIAGIAEEVIYRGVLYGLFFEIFGSEIAAVAICVVAFALGHWVQGRGAMLIIVLFAAGFHLLVRLTGDLYTAIVVHVLYDFVAGFILWWLARGERRISDPRGW